MFDSAAFECFPRNFDRDSFLFNQDGSGDLFDYEADEDRADYDVNGQRRSCCPALSTRVKAWLNTKGRFLF
jgi:hypothetical protein